MKSYVALNLPKQLYQALAEPGLNGTLKLKRVKKLAIDEVEVMLDLAQITHVVSFETPPYVDISSELTPEESPVKAEVGCKPDPDKKISGLAFHEKQAKNRNTSQGGPYLRNTNK